MYLPSYLLIHASVCIYLAIYPSIYLSICLCICLSVCLPIYLSICLPVYLSIYQSIYLSVYLCLFLPPGEKITPVCPFRRAHFLSVAALPDPRIHTWRTTRGTYQLQLRSLSRSARSLAMWSPTIERSHQAAWTLVREVTEKQPCTRLRQRPASSEARSGLSMHTTCVPSTPCGSWSWQCSDRMLQHDSRSTALARVLGSSRATLAYTSLHRQLQADLRFCFTSIVKGIVLGR